MGYKEDYIEQLRGSGVWGKMTSVQRDLVQQLDDNEARVFMTLTDNYETSEKFLQFMVTSPDSAEKDDMVTEFSRAGFINLMEAFEGKLMPQDPTDEPASVLLERIKAEREKRKIEEKSKNKKINVW